MAFQFGLVGIAFATNRTNVRFLIIAQVFVDRVDSELFLGFEFISAFVAIYLGCMFFVTVVVVLISAREVFITLVASFGRVVVVSVIP